MRAVASARCIAYGHSALASRFLSTGTDYLDDIGGREWASAQGDWVSGGRRSTPKTGQRKGWGKKAKAQAGGVVLKFSAAGGSAAECGPRWSPVSIEVREGEHYCIVGCNGSGKTQLLQSILGKSPVLHGNSERTNKDSTIESLSFLSHQEFLLAHGENTVAQTLGGLREAWVRQLIVRFGLYPVWDKSVVLFSVSLTLLCNTCFSFQIGLCGCFRPAKCAK